MGRSILTPIENVADSLRRLVAELQAGDPGNPTILKGILTWGWQTVELLACIRLQAARAHFDVWLQDYLQEVEPELRMERDAYWEERQRLALLEIVDLLSEPDLPLLVPRFYKGWQDPVVRCRGLRQQVTEQVGVRLTATQREQLLLLLAAYQRLVRLPVAVSLDTTLVCAALPALLELVKGLLDPRWDEAQAMRALLERRQEGS